MTIPKNVLVPIDFSETAEHALNYARAVAEQFNAKLHVLHVILDPHAQPWSIEATGMDIGSLVPTWEADAKRRLDELDLGDAQRELLTKIGHPFVEIIRYAKQRDIDLIVMGTHGRGAIEHMLLGSVAEKVVRKAPCPVLTVRHPEHRFERP